MAGDVKRNNRVIPFSGGVLADQPVTEGTPYEMENLLPPAGGGRGLVPRDGVVPVIQLETEDTSGHVIHAVKLDDSARTFLVTVSNAVTGEVVLLSDHMDMEGMAGMVPRGGGQLPKPPPGPPPDFSPIAYCPKVGEGGGYLDIWFYRESDQSISERWGFTISADYIKPRVYRTENWMLGFSEHFDVEDVIKVTCYDLHAIDPEWAGSHQPTHEITVCAFSDFGGGAPVDLSLSVLLPYASDIAFVVVYHNVYRVDVAAGTSTLVGQMSGFPEGVWTPSSHYASGAVCTEGYLWFFMVSTSGPEDEWAVVKVDPTDGSVVGFVPFDDDGDTYRLHVYGLVALSGGEMACFGTNSGKVVFKIDAGATSLTKVSEDEVECMNSGYSGYRANAINDVGIFYDDTGDHITARIYNMSTGTTIRDVSGIRYAEIAPSVMADGERFSWAQYQESDEGLEFVTVGKDSGGPVVIGDLQWSYDLPGYVDGVQDCFAWGIRNVQGDRL